MWLCPGRPLGPIGDHLWNGQARGQVLALQCRVAHALGDEGVGLPWSRRSRWASQGRGDSGADLLASSEGGVGQGAPSTGTGEGVRVGWPGVCSGHVGVGLAPGLLSRGIFLHHCPEHREQGQWFLGSYVSAAPWWLLVPFK